MMRKKEILLFDLDDTLLYTYRTGYQRVIYSLNKMSLELISMEEFKMVYGKIPFDECIIHWVGFKRKDEFIAYYEESKQFKAYEAIYNEKFFADLLYSKFRLGIVTNTPVEKFENKLREVNLDSSVFDYVLCNAQKPSPIGILKAIQHFQVEKEKVIYIGDSYMDYEASLAAEVDFLAVTTGVTTKNEFVQSGLNSSCIFPTVEEIPKYLYQTQ